MKILLHGFTNDVFELCSVKAQTYVSSSERFAIVNRKAILLPNIAGSMSYRVDGDIGLESQRFHSWQARADPLFIRHRSATSTCHRLAFAQSPAIFRLIFSNGKILPRESSLLTATVKAASS